MNIIRIKVIEGPYKGVLYKLISQKITLGRSPNNDIILTKDNKCSRNQAIIQWEPSNNTYSIKDLSNRSSLKINNEVRLKTNLQDGDIIKFGASVLQCEINTKTQPVKQNTTPAVVPILPLELSSPTTPNNNNLTVQKNPLPSDPLSADPLPSDPLSADPLPSVKQNSHYNPYDMPPQPPNVKPRKKKMSNIFRVIVIIIFAGVIFYLSQEEPNKKQLKDKFHTTQDTENTIQNLTELKEEEHKKRQKILLPSYKNAQAAFITGRRDYRKGVYRRAIEAFRVCNTLYPKHKLCYSYLQKAKIKNQQLIQAWMRAGKEYRKNRRYVSCISSFKNVIVTLQDTQNMIYKEALENYKICQIKYQDRY